MGLQEIAETFALGGSAHTVCLVFLFYQGDSQLLSSTVNPPLPSFPEEKSTQWEALLALLRVSYLQDIFCGGARIFLSQGCGGFTGWLRRVPLTPVRWDVVARETVHFHCLALSLSIDVKWLLSRQACITSLGANWPALLLSLVLFESLSDDLVT